MNEAELIKERLQANFQIDSLEVVDDSHKHAHHATNTSGGGHFTLILSSPELKALPRLEAHRKIYALLTDRIPQHIHALSIQLT